MKEQHSNHRNTYRKLVRLDGVSKCKVCGVVTLFDAVLHRNDSGVLLLIKAFCRKCYPNGPGILHITEELDKRSWRK
jgi:hypothetical protein